MLFAQLRATHCITFGAPFAPITMHRVDA